MSELPPEIESEKGQAPKEAEGQEECLRKGVDVAGYETDQDQKGGLANAQQGQIALAKIDRTNNQTTDRTKGQPHEHNY